MSPDPHDNYYDTKGVRTTEDIDYMIAIWIRITNSIKRCPMRYLIAFCLYLIAAFSTFALAAFNAQAEEAVNANVEFSVQLPVDQMQAMQSSWEAEGAQLTQMTHWSKSGGASHTFILGKSYEANLADFEEAAAKFNVPRTVTNTKVWGSKESLDRIKAKHPDVIAGYYVKESEQPPKENIDTRLPFTGYERLGNNAPVQQ